MSALDLNTTPYIEGDFNSYDEALRVANIIEKNSGGYNSLSILEQVANATQKVRRGEAVFERDGVAFDHEDYRYPLLSALFYVAMHEHKLNILDFGGSLGSTYFQNRKLLTGIPVEWNIVEQEHYVEYGRRAVPEINFYPRISDCRYKDINCVLVSCSLNYVDEPYRYLQELLNLNAKYLITDRLYFNFESRNRIMIEHVPETIYKATYPITLLNVDDFANFVLQKYRMVFELPPVDVMPFVENNTARVTPNQGWFFEHN